MADINANLNAEEAWTVGNRGFENIVLLYVFFSVAELHTAYWIADAIFVPENLSMHVTVFSSSSPSFTVRIRLNVLHAPAGCFSNATGA